MSDTYTTILDWFKHNWEWLMGALGIGGGGVAAKKYIDKEQDKRLKKLEDSFEAQKNRDHEQDAKIEALREEIATLQLGQQLMMQKFDLTIVNLKTDSTRIENKLDDLVTYLMNTKIK